MPEPVPQTSQWLTKLPVVVAMSAGVIGVYVFAVFVLADFTLDEASKLGDALGPAVGLTSIIALLVALTSVRLQREALTHQKDDAKKAATAQEEAAKLNAEAIKATIRYQDSRPLRDAYRDWFGRAEQYLSAVLAYADYIAANPGAARLHRGEQQRPVNEAFVSLQQVEWIADLVDADAKRARARGRVMERAPVEPDGPDTPQNHQDNVPTINAWHTDRSIDLIAIHDSLKTTLRLVDTP